jgi:GNAT superfamily N-acetyltransferase/predicted nucleotidyltransferase
LLPFYPLFANVSNLSLKNKYLLKKLLLMKLFPYNPRLLTENTKVLVTQEPIDEINEMETKLNSDEILVVSKDVLNSFNPKATLNQDIWDDMKLKPKVSKQLIKIAKDFIKNLELPEPIKIKDIIFTGSLANYNWSKFSDIDLHIIIDFKQLDSEETLTKDYFLAKKTVWNNEHDIRIFEYPIEIYVQDITEKLSADAIYSIQFDKWNKKPTKEKLLIDKKTIKEKAKVFITKLKDIKKYYLEKNFNKTIDETDKLKDKIKNMRKAGLESGGEFSNENIVFKVLRRISFMDVLYDLNAKAYDQLMSIVETNDLNENISINNVKFKTEKTEDGFEINAFLDNHEIGSMVIDATFNGFWVFDGDLTEEEYEEVFPDDEFMQFTHLSIPDESMRGLGIAKKLMQLAIEKTKQFGLNTIYLNASPMGNKGLNLPDLIGFYESFGFQVFKHQGGNALMVLYLQKSINENKVDDYTGRVLFLLGKELEDGTHRLFATKIKKTLELSRKKTNNTDGVPARMAVFGNNEVFRIGSFEGEPKPLRVDWKAQNLMLDRLGLTTTSVTLNDNKTPAHWLAKEYDNIPKAVKELKSVLKGIPNIRWIN